MLRRFLRAFSLIFAVAFILNLALYALGYAQESVMEPAPWWKPLVHMLLFSVFPALWSTVNPLVTAWLTGLANKSGQYVPRPLQVAISAMLGVFVTIWSGDPTLIAQSAVAGAGGQIIAATDPATLRTESPEAAGVK